MRIVGLLVNGAFLGLYLVLGLVTINYIDPIKDDHAMQAFLLMWLGMNYQKLYNAIDDRKKK